MVHRISHSASESGFAACSSQAPAQLKRNRYRWLRSVAIILALPTFAYADPTVTSLSVLFGSESYNLLASPSRTLPWEIFGVRAGFSEPITSGNVNSVITSGSLSGFSGLGSSTLTWSFSTPLPEGSNFVELLGSGPDALKDATNNALNGGSNETHTFSVLVGDFNGDGHITGADLAGVIAAESQAYNVFADINGDGVVNSADAALVPVPTSIPEPTTIALVGLGIVGLVRNRKEKKRS